MQYSPDPSPRINLYHLFFFLGGGCFTGEPLQGSRARASCSQDVDFRDCDKIPESAWAALGEGVWPHLRNEIGIPEAHLSRLRGQREG